MKTNKARSKIRFKMFLYLKLEVKKLTKNERSSPMNIGNKGRSKKPIIVNKNAIKLKPANTKYMTAMGAKKINPIA